MNKKFYQNVNLRPKVSRFDCRMVAPAVVVDTTVYSQEASRITSRKFSGPVDTECHTEKRPNGP
jgi:hypothetical protein